MLLVPNVSSPAQEDKAERQARAVLLARML